MGPSKLSRNSARRSGDAGAIGISSLGNTAGTSGTQQLGTYVLQGANGITLSQLTAPGQATLVFSGAGAANIALAASGSTQSTGTVQFASTGGSNLVGFSFSAGTVVGTHGGVTSIAVEIGTVGFAAFPVSNRLRFGDKGGVSFALAGVSPNTTLVAGPNPVSYWHNGGIAAAGVMEDTTVGQPFFQRIYVPTLSATRFDCMMSIGGATNGGATHNIKVAVYTMSGSTASLASSALRTFAYNSTLAPSSSFTNVSGQRYRSVSLGTFSFTPGEYMLGIHFAKSSAVAVGVDRIYGGRLITITGWEYPEVLGTTNPYFDNGYLTATTSDLPASIVLSDLSHTGGDPYAQPWITLVGTF